MSLPPPPPPPPPPPAAAGDEAEPTVLPLTSQNLRKAAAGGAAGGDGDARSTGSGRSRRRRGRRDGGGGDDASEGGRSRRRRRGEREPGAEGDGARRGSVSSSRRQRGPRGTRRDEPGMGPAGSSRMTVVDAPSDDAAAGGGGGGGGVPSTLGRGSTASSAGRTGRTRRARDGNRTARPMDPGAELPTHQGFLVKRGKIVKSWKRRWMVLADGILEYYAKPVSGATKAKPKGGIRLVDVLVQPSKDPTARVNCFEIVTAGRTYLIQAADEEEMEEWIDVLQRSVRSATSSGQLRRAAYVGGQEVYVKILLVGESCVGKTAFVRKALNDQFDKKYRETERAGFYQTTITEAGWLCHLIIYDMAGTTRALGPYLDDAAGVIYFFDVCNTATMGKAKKYARDVAAARPTAVPVIVGTKTDTPDGRQVERETATAWAEDLHAVYHEVSAKRDDRDTVSQPLHSVLRVIAARNGFSALPESPDALIVGNEIQA